MVRLQWVFHTAGKGKDLVQSKESISQMNDIALSKESQLSQD